MAKFIFTDLNSVFGTSICEAAGVDPTTVRRIVVDLEVGSPGKLYIETFANDALLGVSIPAGIEIEETT